MQQLIHLLIWTPPFNLTPFKSLPNCKDFPRSANEVRLRLAFRVYYSRSEPD